MSCRAAAQRAPFASGTRAPLHAVECSATIYERAPVSSSGTIGEVGGVDCHEAVSNRSSEIDRFPRPEEDVA